MTTTELLTQYYVQAEQPAWQHELRQSVRLLLALTEPGLYTNALHAALCLVEDELRRQLLASQPEVADSRQAAATAARVVHRHQQDLLERRTEHEVLRRALPVTEFTMPLRRTCRPRRDGGWLPKQE